MEEMEVAKVVETVEVAKVVATGADGEAMTAVSDWVTEAAVERKARAQLQVLSGELSGGCDWGDNSEPLVAAERAYAP